MLCQPGSAARRFFIGSEWEAKRSAISFVTRFCRTSSRMLVSMPTMPSAPPDRMALSIWWILDSLIMFRMAPVYLHDLEGRHQAAADGGDQLLGNDGPQQHGELDPYLLLLAGREHIDDPVDGVGGTRRVQRGDDQMAGLRGGHGGPDGLMVPHLPSRITSGAWRRLARRAVT